ncbi:MAG: sulfatase-like hydrolase/transferase [Planctomycetota bacterium]|nr:sulfatase-like hydrolase/transferase [Planctomycetota bacterium]
MHRARLLLALAATAPAVVAQNENVLVLLLDDVGVEMVGCYGEGLRPANTPVIDSLAQQGVLFRNAWANPSCSPTRATILTGRYGFRTGIGMVVSKNGWDLQEDEVTLPEVMTSAGVAQAGFGKWHLSNSLSHTMHSHPNTVGGFEHWVGHYHNLNQPQSYTNWVKATNGVLMMEDEYATTETVDAFLDWHGQQAGPWFAYVAFHAAHEPWHEPPAHLHNVILPSIDPRFAPYPFYQATIEAMDTEIGRLLSGLGNQLANTHVIVLGDNGTPSDVSVPPFLPSHAKLTPYEGGINVPFLVTGPAVRKPGREVSALINTTDIFTTAIELSGHDPSLLLPPGHVHDSVSFVPYLQNSASLAPREWVFAEIFAPNGGLAKNLDIRILRDDRYKLIRRGLKPASHVFEMYDLERDPFEANDLLAAGGSLSQELQDQFDHLRAELDALLATK